jgi:hypothetical protein
VVHSFLLAFWHRLFVESISPTKRQITPAWA